MNRYIASVIGAVAAMGLTMQADAATVYEGFDYDQGTDVGGLNGGTGWYGSWTGPSGDATIQSPGMSEGSLPGTGNRLLLTRTGSGSTKAGRQVFASNQASGTYWLSLMIDNHGGHSTAFGFAQLADSNSVPLVEVRFSAKGNWSLRNGSGTSSDTGIAADSALLVIKVDMDSDRADMWVNPTLGAEPPATSNANVALAANGDFDRLNLRVQTSTGSASASFDEIRIGDSFASVVPEPGMVALAGLGAGLVGLRRRRQ